MSTSPLLFLEEIEQLKRIPRSGYLMRGLPDVESVAEHSFGVVWVALLLANSMGADANQVMRMALIHDIGEARIGDIPTNLVSRYLGTAQKKAMELAAVRDQLALLPEAERSSLEAVYSELEEGVTAESQIVRNADVLQMMTQVLRYEKTFKTDLSDFWVTAQSTSWLPIARVWYEELLSQHQDLVSK